MDNITHSLVGLALAESALPFRPRRSTNFSLFARVISVAANNVPDLDLFLRPLTPGPLGYLLQHRGYTHTVIASPLLALLLVLLAWCWARVRDRPLAAREWVGLYVLALIGVLAHILLDFFNSYGVHPFWPFFDGWIYGDCLFIVEPAIWLLVLAPLLTCDFSRYARGVLGALFVGGIVLIWATGDVPYSLAALLTVAAFLLLWLSSRCPADLKAHLPLWAGILVILVFGSVSGLARKQIRAKIESRFPGSRLYDIALNPLPANPFCWTFVTVETDSSFTNYYATRGVLAPLSGIFPVTSCPRF